MIKLAVLRNTKESCEESDEHKHKTFLNYKTQKKFMKKEINTKKNFAEWQNTKESCEERDKHKKLCWMTKHKRKLWRKR